MNNYFKLKALQKFPIGSKYNTWLYDCCISKIKLYKKIIILYSPFKVSVMTLSVHPSVNRSCKHNFRFQWNILHMCRSAFTTPTRCVSRFQLSWPKCDLLIAITWRPLSVCRPSLTFKKIFFAETTEANLLKLGRHDLWYILNLFRSDEKHDRRY